MTLSEATPQQHHPLMFSTNVTNSSSILRNPTTREACDVPLEPFAFTAKKSGKNSPLYRRRFFVCNPCRREISYYKTQDDYKRGDLCNRRGVVYVKVAFTTNKRKSRTPDFDVNSRKSSSSSTSSSCSGVSDDGVDENAFGNVEVQDINNRVFHLKGLHRSDMVKVLAAFSLDDTVGKKRTSSGAEREEANRKQQAEKDRRLMELNRIRTELRDRELSTIGRHEDLEERLERAVVSEKRQNEYGTQKAHAPKGHFQPIARPRLVAARGS